MEEVLMIPGIFKTAAVWVIVTFWPFDVLAQEGSQGSRLYQMFVERSREDTALFVRNLKPAERQAIINHVRYLQTLETRGKGYGDDTLFHMGDQILRKQYLEETRKFPGRNMYTIITTGDPTIIENIAPDLFIDEPMSNVGGSDTPAAPTSFRMANAIAHLLKYSPDFNEDVRQWARKQSMITGGEDYREMMREWWGANEKFFKEKNYQAVRPGRDWLQEVRDRADAADRAYAAAQAKAAAATPAPHSPSTAPSSVPPSSPAPLAAEAPASPSQAPWFGYALAGALVLLLGAALYLSNRRRD